MLKLHKEIPAMKKILVSGNNRITEFIHNFLPLRGYEVIDITQLSAFQNNPESLKDAECILDLNNTAVTTTDSTSEYDADFVKELIDFAKTLKTSYLFAYQETENSETESFLVNTLDFIDDYCKELGITFAKILIGDIYGAELTTSNKLTSILNSIVDEKPIFIDNESRDYYLLNQTDFLEGLEEVIKVFKNNKSLLKTYTLLPEEPLTEIELAHFIQDLNELDINITYSDDSERPNSLINDLNLDVNYPETWYPKIDLEQGLKSLMISYGIPVLGTESEELAEEEFLLNEPKNQGDFDDPLMKMWDESYDDTDMKLNTQDSYDSIQDFLGNDYIPAKKKKSSGKKISKKVKASILGVLLLGLLSSPTFFYNNSYTEAKTLLSESIYHLKVLDTKTAAEKSGTALSKFEALKANEIYTSMVPFKSADRDLLESSAKIINNLALGFQLNGKSNVLGTNTFSGIDKALELLNLIENQNELSKINDNPDIKEILDSKNLLTSIREIYPVLPEILGYDKKQRYLILFSNTNYSKPLGDINYYSLITIKEGKSSVEKVSGIEDLNSLIILNGGDTVGEINDIYNEDLFVENSLKHLLNIFNFVSKEKIDGLIVIKAGAVKEIDEINDYNSSLIQSSSNGIQNLLNAFNTNTASAYFKNETVNASFKKNAWTGGLPSNSDDFVYLLSDSTKDNKIIQKVSFSGTYNDESFKRTLVFDLKSNSTEDETGNIQIVLPKNAMLTQAMLKGSEEKNITRTFELDTDNVTVIYKTSVRLKASESNQLIVEYESAPKTKEDGYLHFFIQGPSNFEDVPLEVFFNYPAGIPNTTRIPENMRINNNSLEYSGVMGQNLILDAPL